MTKQQMAERIQAQEKLINILEEKYSMLEKQYLRLVEMHEKAMQGMKTVRFDLDKIIENLD